MDDIECYLLRLQDDEARDRLSALYTASCEAGRAVIGLQFGSPVAAREVLGVIGSTGKRSLPSLRDWHSLEECSSAKERIIHERRLRIACMKLHAAQITGIFFRENRHVGFSTDFPMETDRATELVAHVLSCPKATAETFINAYYVPATEQLIRDPSVWAAIEYLAEAIVDDPRGYLTANEVHELLMVTPRPNTSVRLTFPDTGERKNGPVTPGRTPTREEFNHTKKHTLQYIVRRPQFWTVPWRPAWTKV